MLTSYLPLIFLLIVAWIFLVFVLRKQSAVQLNINTNKNYNFALLDKPKIVKPKYHVPQYMLDLYEENKVKKSYKADVVRSLIPKHAGPMSSNEVVEDHFLVFDLPAHSEEEEEFISAELRILTLIGVKSDLNGAERKLKVSIFDDATKTYCNLEEVHVSHLNNTWLSFNLTKAVTKVFKEEKKSLKIVISVSAFLPYFDNDFRLSLMPVKDNFDHDYPLLLLSYSSKHFKVRKKRNVEDDYEEETNKIWDDDNRRKKTRRNTCRRKPLYIDFSEINFDWIVQPPGYEAFQCQGKCFYPVADHLSPTKHAIVQALLHSVAPLKVSRSCCVPTNLDSISILYVDNDGVLTYRFAYKDMVVLECGCR